MTPWANNNLYNPNYRYIQLKTEVNLPVLSREWMGMGEWDN
jgi:hypothetical protein